MTTDELFAELALTRQARSEVLASRHSLNDRVGKAITAHAVGVFDMEIERLRHEIQARLDVANSHSETDG